MIRHIPLNFYSDYTSGNVSKQWNKHISIFMSLAGLPPKLSNQEFNIFFVATSNIATALELAAPVSFDYSLQEHVLVLPVVLLFMADLPMHAEITSTMQTNVSLQPCRICKLKAKNKKEKATGTYVDNFIGCKPNGYNTVMKVIQEDQDTRLVFNIKKIHEEMTQQLFNPFFELKGFDGHKDTPVEVLHVAKYLIQHYSSLVGKDFKVLIQAEPFESERKIWTSLCHLCSFIFQTHIRDLKKYTAKINYFTQDFLLKLISASAQWVNKPKFHMLIHLSQSIARFGPASLFATEKFESYNGVVCQASIHSNCQSPSPDIANTFLNYSALRYCLSGGYLQTESSRSNISSTYQVKNLLLNTPSIQNLLGLDSQTFKQKPRFPFFF
ncbi:hypothetical protein BY996DRAFT_8556781 [Phakopsora pachyrhizi]|nr:hypothetical protein BY996DRAFT_8556781 [Phakopsora pachyrhizi]